MIKGLKLAAASVALCAGFIAQTPAKAQEYYIGQVLLVGYSFCPRDTAEAKGQLLPINTFQTLFALYGTTFGGDGRTTFGLPNLDGKAPTSGQRYCVVLQGIFPSRS
ncbi:MAG: tail fiber protein [Pseudomonadota bacterium]